MPFEPMPPEEKKIHFAHLYASPEDVKAWAQAYWQSGPHKLSRAAWILALAQAALDAGVVIEETD